MSTQITAMDYMMRRLTGIGLSESIDICMDIGSLSDKELQDRLEAREPDSPEMRYCIIEQVRRESE